MGDVWRGSAYRLLHRRDDGRHVVTDAFLRAGLGGPELAPVAESCAAERALHAALVAAPRAPVAAERLGRLADPDARENYRLWLAFRDRLVAAETVEACYVSLFVEERVALAPPFVDHLAQLLIRALIDSRNGLSARAGELFFRRQRVAIQEGAILAGDAETVERYATSGGFGSLGRLVAEAQTPLRRVTLDVLSEATAASYFDRDERFDTVLDLSFGRAGLDALCRLMEAWVGHLAGARVRIQPVAAIRDEHWSWHLGLDAEASAILNDLYQGQTVDDDRLGRLISLFRLEFCDPSLVLPRISGRPVYLGLAMDADGVLRMKPQNLLVNLPLAARA